VVILANVAPVNAALTLVPVVFETVSLLIAARFFILFFPSPPAIPVLWLFAVTSFSSKIVPATPSRVAVMTVPVASESDFDVIAAVSVRLISSSPKPPTTPVAEALAVTLA